MARFALRAALLLGICVAALRYASHVPSVRAESAPPAEFSAARAMAHVRAIAEHPHPIGSARHRQVAEYIVGELTELGLAPRVQETTAIGTRYAVAGPVRNLLVRVPGTAAGGPAVLLMAHYDAVRSAPGAGDDASGSAVLLETLRALRSSPPLRHDVIALIADGEEAGLLGAAAFVREHPWARDVAVTLNFEARGTRGPSLMFETGAGNLDVVRVLRKTGAARATSLSTFVYRQLPNDTDLSETARLDRPAMNFAFIGGVNRYHTSQDDVAHLDQRSVQDHGESALALARELAGNPLPRPVTGDATFFDVPGLGLVVYPETWSPVFALLVLLPLGWALRTMRRTEHWIRGILLGMGGAVVSIACAAIAGVLAVKGLRAMHGAIGSGAPAQSGVYVAATALLALAISSALHALLRRWSSARALQAGGVAFVAALGILTAFIAPGVSFLFVWPALVMATGLALWNRGAVAEPALWTATAAAAMILLPITYLMGAVALGLDETGAAVVAIFTAMGAWLAAHTMEMWDERPWRGTAMAAGASVLLFAIGAATVRTSSEHPVGSTIGYGVDADSNTAHLGVRASTRAATNALRAQFGSDPVLRPPAWFGRHFRITRPAPAPGPTIATAQVMKVADTTRGDARFLTVRVVPGAGTHAIALHADSGMVRSAAIDGRPVRTDGYRYPQRGRWNIEYVAPGAAGFEIAFVLESVPPVALALESLVPGIPRVPGLELPVRPDGVIPIQRGDFTLVHQRIRIP